MDTEHKFCDAIILANHNEPLQDLGFSQYDRGKTVGDLVTDIESNLRKLASDQGRIPSIFAGPPGPEDDVWDALEQCRGGGVAVFLLSPKFFADDHCVSLFRGAVHLTIDSAKSRFLLFNIGTDEAVTEIRELARDVSLDGWSAEVNHKMRERITGTRVSKRPTDNSRHVVAYGVAQKVWKLWQGQHCILGRDTRSSFRDLVDRVFCSRRDAGIVQVFLGLRANPWSSAMETIAEALEQNLISYHDVGKLRDAAINTSGNSKLIWFDRYHAKIVSALEPKWDGDTRQRLAGTESESRPVTQEHGREVEVARQHVPPDSVRSEPGRTRHEASLRQRAHVLPFDAGPRTPATENTGANPAVGVCILCAVDDEYSATVRVLESFTSVQSQQTDKYFYSSGILSAEHTQSRRIQVNVFQLPRQAQPSVLTSHVLRTLNPAWIFMCGVCSGRQGQVVEGDCIVASCVFHINLGGKMYPGSKFYGNHEGISLPGPVLSQVNGFHDLLRRGKVKLRPSTVRPRKNFEWRTTKVMKMLFLAGGSVEQEKLMHDHGRDLFDENDEIFQAIRSYLSAGNDPCVEISSSNEWVLTKKGRAMMEYARSGNPIGWAGNWPPGTKSEPNFLCASVAVTSAEHSDMPSIWNRLEEIHRKVAGVEMEGYGLFGAVQDENPACRVLLVKAVQDLGGYFKDDTFREYCAELSAVWVMEFVRRFV